jgi:hypothetical protein
MDNNELDVLNQIALGLSDTNIIASICLLGKKQVNINVHRLLKRKMLSAEDGLRITRDGLLWLSRGLANRQYHQNEYTFWSGSGLPYFPYQTRFHKDVLSHPQLFFKAACSYPANERETVYATSLPEMPFTLDSLEILHNLLCESEPLHPTGFWLLRLDRRALCGWGVDNLRKSLQMVERPITILFLCAFNNFIILMSSDLGSSGSAKLQTKVYITRETFPYVDVLDYLSYKLKAILSLNGIRDSERQRTRTEGGR